MSTPGSHREFELRRSDVIVAARHWIGTPYHHQACVKGVGTDCLGLVRGVYRELFRRDAEQPPAYSADWAEALGAETLLDAARRHLVPRGGSEIEGGDVIIFRMQRDARAKHLGIMTGRNTMVHACETSGTIEVQLTSWWQRKIAAVFAFPTVVN